MHEDRECEGSENGSTRCRALSVANEKARGQNIKGTHLILRIYDELVTIVKTTPISILLM